jgi:phage terminase Nu1 subunit (DNA packaging protein)
MGTESELREEIATERRELTEAVSSLRTELEQTAERGKWVGAALGAALAVRTALKVRRHFKD